MGKISRTAFYAILTVLVVIFLPPFVKYQELKYKNKRLEERITELKRETAAMEEEKRLLETDITYVEKKAREKLGVAKKGEIVLKEVPPKKPAKK